MHTRLLTHKWHELLVLTTSAYQAIHGARKIWSGPEPTEHDFHQQVSANLVTLQTCLAAMMGRPLTLDQLRQDVGLMVERITHVTMMLQRCQLRMEEYVCLKVIAMLSQCKPQSRSRSLKAPTQSTNSTDNQLFSRFLIRYSANGNSNVELEAIQERYMQCLQSFVERNYSQSSGRFPDLLSRLPEVNHIQYRSKPPTNPFLSLQQVQSAATLLLESKMFYVPFLLNSAIQR